MPRRDVDKKVDTNVDEARRLYAEDQKKRELSEEAVKKKQEYKDRLRKSVQEKLDKNKQDEGLK